MKRTTLFLLFAVSIALLSTSCKDKPTLLDPTDVIEPSMGKFDGTQDDTAKRITLLIKALFPDDGERNAALNRWNNIQRQMEREQVDAAQSQMLEFADDVMDFLIGGLLLDPDSPGLDPELPDTAEEAVQELITLLLEFVGYVSPDTPPIDPSFFLSEDFGVGNIDPDDGGTVTTGNNWAAVVAEADAVVDPVFITIELLDEETCDLADPLTRAMGCWDINRYPETDFEEDVQVEICVADNPAMTDDEWDLLLLHHKDDSDVVTALPWAKPATVDCDGFGEEAPEETASLSPVRSMLRSMGSRVASILMPEPLGAMFRRIDRPPRGIGGLTGTFSEFFGAVPQSESFEAVPASAQGNLVSWWTGDGNYFDMYGENHGTPQGDVDVGGAGIFEEAFTFNTLDGTHDGVLIEPLSDEVRELEELTLSTWVKLDAGGDPSRIQRFVTLGDGKAVLRQEGGNPLESRMLHFFMDFGGSGLKHISIDRAFQTGCWHFFTGSYDGNWMRAYLDGIEVGSLEVGGVSAVSSDHAKLGASGGPSSTNEGLDGSLDEIMIFDRALTQAEIQAIFDAGGGSKCIPQVISAAAAVDLVSGAYNTWFRGTYAYGGRGMALNASSFQHGSPWANSGMYDARLIPRIATINDPDAPALPYGARNYYSTILRAWSYSYAALSQVAEGLLYLEDPLNPPGGLTSDELDRAIAFGNFVQGMAHATIATTYSEGMVLDQSTSGPPVLLDYNALMASALGYFDEAINAPGGWTSLPFEWMRATLSPSEFIRVAHSMKARFMASVARTPVERAAVNWNAVVAEVNQGITGDFLVNMDWNEGWYNQVLDYNTWPSWSQMAYFMVGMADGSGNFQAWDDLELEEKLPNFSSGDPVLIVTPDLRFPRGTTVADQRAISGTYFRINTEAEEGDTWALPTRGTWNWSWYKISRGLEYGLSGVFDQPEIRIAEMDLLKAEGLYRTFDHDGAAGIINTYRTAAGLNLTDEFGANSSCVPRLPDGSCGDLWEMLKWEKRMETTFTGLMAAGWFWDARGWGDLWKDTPVQLPIPCTEAPALGRSCIDFGGPGGAWAAPLSTYQWNGEGG